MGVMSSRGGVTRSGYDSALGGGGYVPDDYMGMLNAQAARMNAAQPRGGYGGSGGGGGGRPVESPSGSFYDPNRQGWNWSPDLQFQVQKSAADTAFQQGKFNAVWGQLQRMLAGGANPAAAGGASPASPEISVGGVLNPQQVQQQVNAARAGNDSSTADRARQFAGSAVGRGFAPGSPMIAAMQAQFAGQGMAANADAERQIRLGAAQANAGQLLQGQQAREQQFASRQQEDIQRRLPYFQQQNALIAALAGLA